MTTRYKKHSEGLTRDQQRYLDGPDYEVEMIVYCPGCRVERELLVTGYREDKIGHAYCSDCDTTVTIIDDEEDDSDYDYPW